MIVPRLLALFLLAAPAAADAPPDAARDGVRRYVAARQREILVEFRDLLAIPNLAGDAENIRRNARAIAALLERRGVKTRLLEEPGAPPAVWGELSSPGAARTVVFYAHYDGQPVDPSQWTGEPWKPLLRDGALESGGREIPWDAVSGAPGSLPPEARIYARSAGDDKAAIVGFLAALDALRALRLSPSVNLRFFLDGEEEAGSPHLKDVLRRHASELSADGWVFCDGPVHQSRRPLVFFGARGIVDVELEVYGPNKALHSGHYGNWAPNPIAALAELLAAMRDSNGRILIPGFADDVRPLTAAERLAVSEMPPIEAELKRELGIGRAEASGPIAEATLAPSLNLRGVAGGHVGEKAANAIPTEARASIDFRLVPDQTPDGVRRRVEDFVKERGFFIVREDPDLPTRLAHPRIVKMSWGPGYPPERTPLDAPFAAAVLRTAESAAAGPVVRAPSLGGSLPIYVFREVLGVPTVGVPIANHDDNQHAANENLRLRNLWDGIELYAALFADLGRNWK